MITFERMHELYRCNKEIFVLNPYFDFGLRITIIKLNKNIFLGKRSLYLNGKSIADYEYCFEKIDFKHLKLNGVKEDCVLMYSYNSIDDE